MTSRLLLAAALLAACAETNNEPRQQLNLDRPIDVAFACYGGVRVNGGNAAQITDPVTVSAQPVSSCEFRSQFRGPSDPLPVPFGQEDLTGMGGSPLANTSWYGLILQGGPGTVAISQFVPKPARDFTTLDIGVIDTDLLTPGKNSISVGEDPVAIVTDKLGCHAVTANAGSCDLSVLDITSAIGGNRDVRVDRLAVKNMAGQEIFAKPAAMVVEPPGGQIGTTCPERPGGLVYVAYPGCNLVAGIDMSTGTIVTGIQYDALGVPRILPDGNVTCNDECGRSGNRGLPTAGIRPVTLDLEVDPRITTIRRLVIGADNSPSATVVELDLDSKPVSLSQIAFENTTGNLGITQVALSPVVGIGGTSGEILDEGAPGGDFQFLYAIATDDSVRVADLLNLSRECDTQVDPRFLRDIRDLNRLPCLPVGDPLTPPRRATAVGPGLRLGVPLSIDIVKSEFPPPPDPASPNFPPASPRLLVGYYGIIATVAGVFVMNIDDDYYDDLFNLTAPLSVPVSNTIAHQLRDANFVDRGALSQIVIDGTPQPLCAFNGPVTDQGDAIGSPRAATVPLRNAPAGNIAPEKLLQLPYFRQLACTGNDTVESGPRAITELSFSAPVDSRDFTFPDLRAMPRDETWALTWEGTLSLDRVDTAIDGPPTREGEMTVDVAGIHIKDQAKPFCDAGVQPRDIVQLRGCNAAEGDLDCPIGYRCFVHPQSQVAGVGACMLADEAERLADACKDFLTSRRRYTVKTAQSGELVLVPRRHELRTTPLDGCTSDAQCESLADYALRAVSVQHPVDDRTGPDTHTWACHADPTRAPRPPNDKRCVMKCDTTADCVAGTVCQSAVAGQPMSGFCMEGVVPPQSCVNAPQRYELRAGEAFAVIGSRTGFLHATIEGPGETCVRDPNASAYLTGRIPLTPPPCNPMANRLTGRLPNGTFDNNPCALDVEQTDVVPNYVPGTCASADPPTMLAQRPAAPGILFRNPMLNLTLVDLHYPGDQTCLYDRMGNLGKIPMVFPGFQLQFRAVGGFFPVISGFGATPPTYPIKVVRGPTSSIWVIDEGDFLSSSVGIDSTRGKVFRIESNDLRLTGVLE